MGTKFVEGFKNEQGWEYINRHSEFITSITNLITAILTEMDSHSEDFKSKGKTAGEQYAAGFNQGLTESGIGSLTPIVAMDASGKTATGDTLTAMLTAMGYATSTDIAGLATRLDTINNHFNQPIAVNDSHADIVSAIGTTNDKLKSIGDDVGTLKSEVNNLKVYINSKILVGAIASDMNRELGKLVNVSNP